MSRWRDSTFLERPQDREELLRGGEETTGPPAPPEPRPRTCCLATCAFVWFWAPERREEDGRARWAVAEVYDPPEGGWGEGDEPAEVSRGRASVASNGLLHPAVLAALGCEASNRDR